MASIQTVHPQSVTIALIDIEQRIELPFFFIVV